MGKKLKRLRHKWAREKQAAAVEVVEVPSPEPASMSSCVSGSMLLQVRTDYRDQSTSIGG